MEVISMFSFSFERSNQPTLALQERVDPVETGAGRGEKIPSETFFFAFCFLLSAFCFLLFAFCFLLSALFPVCFQNF